MFPIEIDDLRYHANLPDDKAHAFAAGVYQKAAAKYPELPKLVANTLGPLHLSKEGRRELAERITLAFCHVMKSSFPPKTYEEILQKVKKWMAAFLPCIAKNTARLRLSHPVQYEPIAASALSLATTCLDRLTSINTSKGEFEDLYLWELANLFRAVRSSLLLLLSGDDAHGCALLRGVLEIVAKLKLADRFAEEYVLFKRINAARQEMKFTGKAMPTEFAEYLKNVPEYRQNPEGLLAYGWAKNQNGRRILSMTEFIKEGTEQREIDGLLQVASEFTHEDYVGVGYDYPSIRKALIDYYYFILREVFKDKTLIEVLGKKERSAGRALVNLADAVYAGECPLS